MRKARRLAVLERFRILDTPPEAAFDDIVTMAAQICDAPVAMISLIDRNRQWFKAAIGVNLPKTPRDVAFCAHAIEQTDIFLIEDAASDPRFADNPLVNP